MAVRIRSLLGLLAVVAALAVGVVLAADEPAPADGPATHAITATAGTRSPQPAVRNVRDSHVEHLEWLLPTMGLALASGLLAVGVRRRSARRIADDGDSWRALLLGAPPAPASS